MRSRPLGGLSCAQRDLLASIAANPGANAQELWTAVKELRQETVSKSTVSDQLDELAKRGLVEKTKG